MSIVAYALIALPIALAAYAYVIYPLTLAWMPKSPDPRPVSASNVLPLVTIVIPAYNEERQIAGAIEAALAQDYPAAHRQILVLSDASSDGTDGIVKSYAHRGVELLRMSKRMGKTAAENESASSIRGEIVVNTDSSVRLHPEAVRHLVAALSDPTVGVASTVDVSISNQESANQAEAGYVGYEMRVRELETLTGGIIGASGSGYAIRAELHRLPVRRDLSRDFSAALTARRHGFRAVSVREAICFVPRTGSLRVEYRRKVRTISRGMETLSFNRDLLDFTTYGSFAWKLLSHKLCRWLIPLAAVVALVGLALLANVHAAAGVILGVGAFVLVAAIVFSYWPDERRLSSAAAAIAGVLTGNLAVLHAAWRFFHGHDDHVWEPTRRTVAGAPALTGASESERSANQ
jgi:cellulose synthase/poly-beta-1,6-N-acetylglucosamine synthase-like glycosyltransferase